MFCTVSVRCAETGRGHPRLLRRFVENHFDFVPTGEGPFPTVIAIPGCSGIAFNDPAAEAGHSDLNEDDRLSGATTFAWRNVVLERKALPFSSSTFIGQRGW